MKNYIEAIRETVCAVCVDSQNGECTLSGDEYCAVEVHAAKIIKLVQKSEAEDFQTLYDEMKLKICADCRDESDNGDCSVRKDANCSLDRYFPLIVDTIKKVNAGTV